MELIFGCQVPTTEDIVTKIKLAIAQRQPDFKYQIMVFNRSVEVFAFKGKGERFSYAREYAIISLKPDVLLSKECKLFDSLSEYAKGTIDIERFGNKVLDVALRFGIAQKTLDLAEESELIRTGKISGAPNFESRELPVTKQEPLYFPDHRSPVIQNLREDMAIDEEIPITYTRAEVIEIIKMIRPDIADVQMVIDKLLFKP